MDTIVNLEPKKPVPPPPKKRPDPKPRYVRESQDPDKKPKS